MCRRPSASNRTQFSILTEEFRTSLTWLFRQVCHLQASKNLPATGKKDLDLLCSAHAVLFQQIHSAGEGPFVHLSTVNDGLCDCCAGQAQLISNYRKLIQTIVNVLHQHKNTAHLNTFRTICKATGAGLIAWGLGSS